MERKVFSELRSKCKTARQMKAFNELVKSFTDRLIMMSIALKGGISYSDKQKDLLYKIFEPSVIEACNSIGLKYRSTRTKIDTKARKNPNITIVVDSGKLSGKELDKLTEAIYDKLEENGFDTTNSSIWLNEIDYNGNAVY